MYKQKRVSGRKSIKGRARGQEMTALAHLDVFTHTQNPALCNVCKSSLARESVREKLTGRRGREHTELTAPFHKAGWCELFNMGCSLCTLQKPAERYKLLYEVCRVTDFSFFTNMLDRIFGECKCGNISNKEFDTG